MNPRVNCGKMIPVKRPPRPWKQHRMKPVSCEKLKTGKAESHGLNPGWKQVEHERSLLS